MWKARVAAGAFNWEAVSFGKSFEKSCIFWSDAKLFCRGYCLRLFHFGWSSNGLTAFSWHYLPVAKYETRFAAKWSNECRLRYAISWWLDLSHKSLIAGSCSFDFCLLLLVRFLSWLKQVGENVFLKKNEQEWVRKDSNIDFARAPAYCFTLYFEWTFFQTETLINSDIHFAKGLIYIPTARSKIDEKIKNINFLLFKTFPRKSDCSS